MTWIECHHTLFDHPKTIDLSENLGCSLNDSIVGLLRFWCWCLEYADSGDLRKHKPKRIAHAFGIPRSSPHFSGETLMKALVDAGWVDAKPFLRVHNWWQHAGLFLQNRYKRQPSVWKKIRASYGEGGEDFPELPLECARVRHACSTSAAHDHRTVPDSTVPDRTVPPPHHPGADDAAVFDRIYAATRTRLSRKDRARICLLRQRYGEQFDIVCERLHSGIDNVPAYLQAALEPLNSVDPLARELKELLRARETN
jgi:hypothetical protein